MNAQPMSIGFVGGAPNSAVGNAHYVASRMDGLWRLDAGSFSRDPMINALAGRTYAVEGNRIYSSFEDIIRDERERLDALVLLTPTPNHYEMVLACLEAGIPTICEKSLCINSVQAEHIHKVCVDNKGFLAVIYNYSGYPMVREMRRLIRSGALGDILHFQVEMPQEGYVRTDAKGTRPEPQSWRLRDNDVPVLYLDLAVHLHELLHYLIELQPLEVVASQGSYGWFDVIDNASCMTRYEKGVQGQFWFSKSSLGHRNGLRLRLYGSEASAEWYQMNPEELQLSFRNGRRETLDRASDVQIAHQARYARFKAGHPAGFSEALANLYFDIHQSLLQYKNNGVFVSDEVFSSELSLNGLKWIEAMVRSCKSRAWEAV